MTWVALDDSHAKTAMVLATARAAPEAWEVVYEEGQRGQICPLGSTRARLLRLLRPRLVALGGSTLPGQRGVRPLGAQPLPRVLLELARASRLQSCRFRCL